jgi:hypothetical protein
MAIDARHVDFVVAHGGIMTPEDQCERWRERVTLFKQQAQARFAAGMALQEAALAVADQLPDGNEKALLVRAADEYFTAEVRINEAFWHGWEKHRAKWPIDSEAGSVISQERRGGPTRG